MKVLSALSRVVKQRQQQRCSPIL